MCGSRWKLMLHMLTSSTSISKFGSKCMFRPSTWVVKGVKGYVQFIFVDFHRQQFPFRWCWRWHQPMGAPGAYIDKLLRFTSNNLGDDPILCHWQFHLGARQCNQPQNLPNMLPAVTHVIIVTVGPWSILASMVAWPRSTSFPSSGSSALGFLWWLAHCHVVSSSSGEIWIVLTGEMSWSLSPRDMWAMKTPSILLTSLTEGWFLVVIQSVASSDSCSNTRWRSGNTVNTSGAAVGVLVIGVQSVCQFPFVCGGSQKWGK